MSALVRSRRRAQGWQEADAVHDGEDLRSLSAFQSRFANVSFENCEAGLADFTGAALSSSSFENTKLYGSRFGAATLDKTSLYGCDLEQASFAGAVLRDVRFVGCRLSYASFAGATLRGVTFQDCNMHGADCDFLEAHDVAFEGSNLWAVKAAFGCAFWNAKFDERSANYFAAMLGRIHPNSESAATISGAAGPLVVRAVDRLMRSRDEAEKQAEAEAPQALLRRA